MAKVAEILLVDDDRMALVVLQHQLMELGYTTETLTSGVDALALLDREPDRFDVIILDRLMPEMDGIAMTREIARRDHLKSIPTIMVTGADSPEEMKQGIDAGVFYYIPKPVKKPLVQSVVGAALRQRKLNASLSAGADGTPAFALIEGAKFAFRTIEEAEMLAGFIANAFPEPQRTVNGAAALMVNAVEHGICQIGYETKGALLRDGQLREGIAERLAAHPDATAHAVIAVKHIPRHVSQCRRPRSWDCACKNRSL